MCGQQDEALSNCGLGLRAGAQLQRYKGEYGGCEAAIR